MARVDRCFTTTRPVLEESTLKHYWYDLPHNNFVKRNEPLLPASKQYCNIRTKNDNFNPAINRRNMNEIIRRDLDPDFDVKQDCYNPFPSLSRGEVDNLPLLSVIRNGNIKTDPKSIMNNVGTTDRTANKISRNQYKKVPMRQTNGVVI